MKPTRIAFALLAAALVVLVATACGSKEESVPADAVAVVDGTPITKTELDALLARAKKTYAVAEAELPEGRHGRVPGAADAGRRVPRPARGVRQEAEELKLAICGQGRRRRIAADQEAVLRRQPGEARQALKAQGYDEGDRSATTPRTQLLSEKIYAAVTKDAKVTDAEIAAYYKANKSQYVARRAATSATSSSRRRPRPTRSTSRSRPAATSQALAKKYSIGPGSKDNGGKLTITPRPDRADVRHGRVPADDEADLEAGQVPVRLPRDPADLRHQAVQTTR